LLDAVKRRWIVERRIGINRVGALRIAYVQPNRIVAIFDGRIPVPSREGVALENLVVLVIKSQVVGGGAGFFIGASCLRNQ